MKKPEKAGDRNIRELIAAAQWASGFPCQRKRGTTCPCGPCAAKRVLKRLERGGA